MLEGPESLDYNKRKTKVVAFSDNVLLHIVSEEIYARLWFSNANGTKIPIPDDVDVFVTDTNKALLKPFMGFYFITWSSDYLLEKNGDPFLRIKSAKTQFIERV